MKKLLLLLFVLGLMMACGQKEEPAPAEEAPAVEETMEAAPVDTAMVDSAAAEAEDM